MKKREHRLFIRVTDEERNRILDKMYGMGIRSLSAYIRKMALDGYCLNLDLPQLRRMAYLLLNSAGAVCINTELEAILHFAFVIHTPPSSFHTKSTILYL